MLSYGIVFPVYNEEKRINKGIIEANSFFESLGIDYSILIVDNASTDKTSEMARKLVDRFEKVEYLCIKEKGVGIAVKKGFQTLKTDIVGYMDIDLATDLKHFKDVVYLFENDDSLQIVNGSRFHEDSLITGKKWYRNITSYGLLFLLKAILKMKASDAICGFKFFKKQTVEKLMEECSEEPGWFFIIEIILRAERKKLNIKELPVTWDDDADNSKVKIIETTINYIKSINRLKKSLKKCNDNEGD